MLSIPHLIIIFVVALVVFGPEKLPELARNLGKFMGEFRKATGDLRSTFEGHMRDLEREAEERKIGGSPAATAGAAAPLPAAAPDGTITANAPNKTITMPKPSEGETVEAAPQLTEQHELNPENVSDGGSRPA